MTGTIYKSTGSWYVVRTADGGQWNARIKGIFKLDEITSTNPLAVGDVVELEPGAEGGDEATAMITAIHDRKNYINRQSPSHKMQHHIIAANVDQSLLIATLKEPRTSQGFIDRHLVACEAYHVPAIVVFNKADLYKRKEDEKFSAWKEMYEAIGYRIIRMSVQTGEGVAELEALLRGKTSLLSGHSGVGKSSLLNAILPDLKLKTQGVSGWSGKGIHTTTFAEMYDLPGAPSVPGHPAGRIIDTPGMREFGLVDISKAELSGYFPEMRALVGQCQFNNCVHREEPGCAVKQAVREGRIHEDRYISYCGILDSIGEKNY
ncbi:MAG: ribosome small subunit-dependent GTPase A [Bacteroidota bacterium]|nr:ribosome small subunit-dependent GTPase A [Bacteroidota bacterium]MDP4214828.1 ribosome small subunit-dependent GTPase A [Bacteroidota bacterium]MDP4253130.1 ribosome small subunit-dependent GTPase A [Bacteroidota bacterium]MDP4259026.1 ribosome small subunit-dependent GTPase A [Bacteroidota bacterium]